MRKTSFCLDKINETDRYLMVIVTLVFVLSALNLIGIVLVIKTMRQPLLSKS